SPQRTQRTQREESKRVKRLEWFQIVKFWLDRRRIGSKLLTVFAVPSFRCARWRAAKHAVGHCGFHPPFLGGVPERCRAAGLRATLGCAAVWWSTLLFPTSIIPT